MKVRYGKFIQEEDTWNITSISFDNANEQFRFILEKGLRVEAVTVSIESAMGLGIFNIKPLEQFSL